MDRLGYHHQQHGFRLVPLFLKLFSQLHKEPFQIVCLNVLEPGVSFTFRGLMATITAKDVEVRQVLHGHGAARHPRVAGTRHPPQRQKHELQAGRSVRHVIDFIASFVRMHY